MLVNKKMNLKGKLIFLISCLICSLSSGQILQPASWTYDVTDRTVEIGDEIDLIFRARIDENWYLFSSDFDPDLGPKPTTFSFIPNSSYELIGELRPIGADKKYDELWEGEYTYFNDLAEFRQTIRVLGKPLYVEGEYEYQVCTDLEGKCIPFDDEFRFANFQVVEKDSSPEKKATPEQNESDSEDLGITFAPAGKLTPSIQKPADWKYDVTKEKIKVGDELELIFKVNIEDGWHLFSSDFKMDPGPMVTTFHFEPHKSYELIGNVEPVGAEEKKIDNDIWSGTYTYFNDEAEFRQKVKVLASDLLIKGYYEYQVCTDESGVCIPFEEDFAFTDFVITGERLTKGDVAPKRPNPLLSRTSNDPYSLAGFMLAAFIAGLLALLTPCVFPMIPMTVTFFTGRGSKRQNGATKAFLYGFSIIIIYTIVGSIIAPFMGPETANDLATNWIPNLIFFAVFLIFGLSFLGLFDITLPSSFVNKVDKQADKGGYIGVFFMAFTLVLVSFSCTGPIVGSILVESAGGQSLKPVLGMFSFSLAFALPFTLFAIFPEWLQGLPKSGGWLNSVKVVLGFLELALSLKFLSVADQAYHWGILDREIYLSLWIVIFTLMGFYLLGKIRLPHDSKQEVIGVPRLIFALITFSFVVYLIPGLFGAPLKSLSGYLPPITTHDFNVSEMLRENKDPLVASKEQLCDKPKYADFLHFPHGIKGYFDYQQALQCAREKNKPLFIDFTGHGCVNCREMEARVWSEPEVLSRLKEDFVVVALYVDDKTVLPEEEWYRSGYDNRLKKTIGKQNADFQITRFNNNAQPYYVILDANEELLTEPIAYDLNVNNFVAFLDEAKTKFQIRNIASR